MKPCDKPRRLPRCISRRASLLAAVVAVAALTVSLACDDDGGESPGSPVDGLDGSLVVNTSGGAYETVFAEAWWGPFSEATGVEVSATSPHSLASVREQVESGQVEWDIAELGTGGEYLQAVREGLAEEIDLERYNDLIRTFGGNPDDLIEGSVGTHGAWETAYATVLVFDERAFPDGSPQPSTLADLWNLEEFPGPRCIQSSAYYNLEMALRADGVAASEMYPLDVERALAKLEDLKPHIAEYWTVGGDATQFVIEGRCVMGTAWNGRPFAAEVLDGIDYLGVAMDGGTLHTSWFIIPRGSQNVEVALAALAYYTLAEVGAEIANQIAYANANARAGELVSAAALPFLATTPENLAVLTPQDDAWWDDHGEETQALFAELMLDR